MTDMTHWADDNPVELLNLACHLHVVRAIEASASEVRDELISLAFRIVNDNDAEAAARRFSEESGVLVSVWDVLCFIRTSDELAGGVIDDRLVAALIRMSTPSPGPWGDSFAAAQELFPGIDLQEAANLVTDYWNEDPRVILMRVVHARLALLTCGLTVKSGLVSHAFLPDSSDADLSDVATILSIRSGSLVTADDVFSLCEYVNDGYFCDGIGPAFDEIPVIDRDYFSEWDRALPELMSSSDTLFRRFFPSALIAYPGVQINDRV